MTKVLQKAAPPAVSIVIDNYNYGRYLPAAIESALAQTAAGVEVVVVDDGSTDESREIVARYGSRIVPVLKENGGQASALNAGFAASRGRIVFFLDADDTLFPHTVARVAPLFTDAGISKVHGPLLEVEEDGRPNGKRRPRSPLPAGDLRDPVMRGGPTSCLSAPTTGNAWARAFLEAVLPIPEDVAYYRTCADEYLYTLAPVLGRIGCITEPFGTYRLHAGSIYSGRSFAGKLRLELAGHAQQCEALGRTLRRLGIAPDLSLWHRHSWFHRLESSLADIHALIPAQEKFVLVDDQTWDAEEIFGGSRIVPFPEREGTYGGPPADDGDARAEWERVREETGVRYLIVAWPSFWWLEHYPGLAAHLRGEASCLLANERLQVFRFPPVARRRSSPVQAARPAFPRLEPVTGSPLVTVMINNFNYGRFLGSAIDSALDQTYPNLEVVVVDDGSSDESAAVIERYGRRIRPVLKANGGQASAYNAGFHVSRGELICNLDADDTLFSGAIERAVDAFRESDAVKVQWPLAVVDAAGRATGELSVKKEPPRGDLRERLLREGPVYDFLFTTGCLLKRGFLERVLPMPEPPYRNGADVYLLTLAPVYGRILSLHQTLGTYRAHGRNNYRDRGLDEERLRDYLQRFETNARVLQEHLERLGGVVDADRWRRENFNYLWPHRLLRAKAEIEALVPPGNSFVLINDDEWGHGELIAGRSPIPFVEREGAYGGPPADDATAIAELERLRAAGAAFVVVWWTSFWWLDHFARFHRYLRDRFHCVRDDDGLIIFDLRCDERDAKTREAA